MRHQVIGARDLSPMRATTTEDVTPGNRLDTSIQRSMARGCGRARGWATDSTQLNQSINSTM